MGTVNASAERRIDAPAPTVYGYIADMRHQANFLPPQFSGFTVESGGVGAGTVVRCTFSTGKRTRDLRLTVAEPEPGRVLTESDSNSTLVTTFTVTPDGQACNVRIATSWQGAGGIGGFFERTFAPKALARIYTDELERLNSYAQRQGMQAGPE